MYQKDSFKIKTIFTLFSNYITVFSFANINEYFGNQCFFCCVFVSMTAKYIY